MPMKTKNDIYTEIRDAYLKDVDVQDWYYAHKIINGVKIYVTHNVDNWEDDETSKWSFYEAFVGIELCLKLTGRFPMINETFVSYIDDTNFLKIKNVRYCSLPMHSKEDCIEYEIEDC